MTAAPSVETLARREKIALLHAQGRTTADIAEVIGITERSVQRHLNALGFHRPVWVWTEESLLLAEYLLADQCPYAEVARTLGCPKGTLRRRFPGYGLLGNPLGNGFHARMATELGLEIGDFPVAPRRPSRAKTDTRPARRTAP